MFKNLVCVATLMLMLWAAVACSPAPAIAGLAPTPPPLDLPTLFPPTAAVIPTATSAPTAIPAATHVPTAIITSAPAAAATNLPTPTSPPAATITLSAPSPTSAGQAGLVVTGLRTNPDPPVRGPDLRFIVTFANSTGRDQNYTWLVYIFKADTPNKTFGETTRTSAAIPNGTTEQTSVGSWKLPLGGPCDYFFARVVWFTAENKAIPFTTPDGKVFEKGLTVCPP